MWLLLIKYITLNLIEVPPRAYKQFIIIKLYYMIVQV
jgi:hypothetical protein